MRQTLDFQALLVRLPPSMSLRPLPPAAAPAAVAPTQAAAPTPAAAQQSKPKPSAAPISAGGRAANDPREIKRRALAAAKEQSKTE